MCEMTLFVTWLVVQHSFHVWHDSSYGLYVPYNESCLMIRLMCDMTLCVTWLYVWHDSMCDMTLCVTWLHGLYVPYNETCITYQFLVRMYMCVCICAYAYVRMYICVCIWALFHMVTWGHVTHVWHVWLVTRHTCDVWHDWRYSTYASRCDVSYSMGAAPWRVVVHGCCAGSPRTDMCDVTWLIVQHLCRRMTCGGIRRCCLGPPRADFWPVSNSHSGNLA